MEVIIFKTFPDYIDCSLFICDSFCDVEILISENF